MWTRCGCLALLCAVGLAWANPCAEVVPVLASSLDDSASVTAWGGELTCGSFVDGMYRQAFHSQAPQDDCVRIPLDPLVPGFPWSGGSLDFWFRLNGYAGALPTGYAPALVLLEQGGSRYGVWLGRDPASGLVGLMGAAGVGNLCATTDSGFLDYSSLLSPGGLGQWHHAALFWHAAGIPEVQSHRVALFVDGALHSTGWSEAALSQFPPREGAWLSLARNDSLMGSCEVDELHVFPYALDWPYRIEHLCQMLMQIGMMPEMPYVCLGAEEALSGFQLSQNQPNPFNPGTTIRFQLPQSELVTLKVYDLAGREVASLLEGLRPRGLNEVRFDGAALASGLYYYRLEAGALRETRGMLLLK